MLRKRGPAASAYLGLKKAPRGPFSQGTAKSYAILVLSYFRGLSLLSHFALVVMSIAHKAKSMKNPNVKHKLKFTPGFLALAAAGMECCFNEIHRRARPVLIGFYRGRGVLLRGAIIHADKALTNFWLSIKTGKFKPEKINDGDVLPFIITVAKRTYADVFRDEARQGITLGQITTANPADFDLDGVSDKHRDIIELKIRGFSYRAIAELTRVPVGTVKAVISRKRKEPPPPREPHKYRTYKYLAPTLGHGLYEDVGAFKRRGKRVLSITRKSITLCEAREIYDVSAGWYNRRYYKIEFMELGDYEAASELTKYYSPVEIHLPIFYVGCLLSHGRITKADRSLGELIKAFLGTPECNP